MSHVAMPHVEDKPPPEVSLGDTHCYNPLNPSNDFVSSSTLVQSVLSATNGGYSTTEYFNQVNALGLLYGQLSQSGRSGWTEETDDNDMPVHYVAADDGSGKFYCLQMALEGVTFEESKNLNGEVSKNVVSNGTEWGINGETYKGIAVLTATASYNDISISVISRDVGILAGSMAAGKILWPVVAKLLPRVIKAAANVFADYIKIFASKVGLATPEALEAAVGEAVLEAEGSLAVEGEVAVAAAEVTGVLFSTFVGAGIFFAIVFLVLAYLLHFSYHRLRIWNFTRYRLDWDAWFEHCDITSGIVSEDKDHKRTRLPIQAVSNKSPAPAVKTNQLHVEYGDLNIKSSSEVDGIDYVIQCKLSDPVSKAVVYEVTTYYDIPLAGRNSTNTTFDHVQDMYDWYRKNQGNNPNVRASSTSKDGKLTATTTYDFLEGSHPVPTKEGGNEYFYQSLLTIYEKDLKISDLPQ